MRKAVLEAPEDNKMGDNTQLEQLQAELTAVKAKAFDTREALEGQLAQINQAVGEIAQAAGVDSLQALYDFVVANKPAEEVSED